LVFFADAGFHVERFAYTEWHEFTLAVFSIAFPTLVASNGVAFVGRKSCVIFTDPRFKIALLI